MFLLPKGKPWVEHFPITRLLLPDALAKLKNGKLTGCATFNFPAAVCILSYEDGNLISAVIRRETSEQKDAEALRALVDLMMLADSGSFTVHGFSNGVNQALLALLRGDRIVDQQELKPADFKALHERIRLERMTATLKVSVDQRVGMIFYRNGETAGFFHDTAQIVENSAGEVQRIAALPGGAVDLFVLGKSEIMVRDLAETVNIQSLWESVKGGGFTSTEPIKAAISPTVSVAAPLAFTATSSDIESTILAIAYSSLGKLGKTLAEKELINVGGIKALKDKTKLSDFLNAMGKNSKLLASAHKVQEALGAILAEAARL